MGRGIVLGRGIFFWDGGCFSGLGDFFGVRGFLWVGGLFFGKYGEGKKKEKDYVRPCTHNALCSHQF